MIEHSHDSEAKAHYFGLNDEHGFGPLVSRTQEIGVHTVNVDYDEYGNVVGIELL